ncbi:hypothetical protein AB0H86_04830 [Streptomyces sp. NPDC050997]|uniref:hypothetical protein n=1 Tax=Streptomyces sp. NPDC050997 TaxID=3155519 RepID=UPI0034377B8D
MTAAVVILTFPVAACDSQEQAKEPKAEATPSTLCGVQLSAGARKALLNLVGGKELDSNGSKESLSDTARALASGYHENGADDYEEYDLCTAFGSATTAGADLSFYLSEKVPTSISPKFTQYDMGELTLSRPSHAALYMKCSSDKFRSSSKPILIEGKLTNAQAPPGDAEKVREENLNVLHAVTLAMAKQLGCERDADLPQQFSSPPKLTED